MDFYIWGLILAGLIIAARLFGHDLIMRLRSAWRRDVGRHRRYQSNLRDPHGAYRQAIDEILAEMPAIQTVPGPNFVWDGITYPSRKEAEEARLRSALEKARTYYQERDRDTALISWRRRRRF